MNLIEIYLYKNLIDFGLSATRLRNNKMANQQLIIFYARLNICYLQTFYFDTHDLNFSFLTGCVNPAYYRWTWHDNSQGNDRGRNVCII